MSAQRGYGLAHRRYRVELLGIGDWPPRRSLRKRIAVYTLSPFALRVMKWTTAR